MRVLALLAAVSALAMSSEEPNPGRKTRQGHVVLQPGHVEVSLSSTGQAFREGSHLTREQDIAVDRQAVMRRDSASKPAVLAHLNTAEDSAPNHGATPDSCDNGGVSSRAGIRTLKIDPPESVPFTIAFRFRYLGEKPVMPVQVCIICWTIDKDTAPSTDRQQFVNGTDGQPPFIGIKLSLGRLLYEELSADGGTGKINTLTTEGANAADDIGCCRLDDGEYHDVVLTRGERTISFWIGRPNHNLLANTTVEKDRTYSEGVQRQFKNPDLPTGAPKKIEGYAHTADVWSATQAKNTVMYSHRDPYNADWGFDGQVKNVRFYNGRVLPSQDFPNFDLSCEEEEHSSSANFQCHPTCSRCKGSTENDCTACKGVRFLHDAQCLELCPAGTFGEADNKCAKCHSSCSACHGDGEYDCESCATDKYLSSGGNCVEECEENSFKTEDGVCQKLPGAVVALKSMTIPERFIASKSGTCVKTIELDDEEHSNPLLVKGEEKMWMLSDLNGGLVTLRNVLTGLVLHLPESLGGQLDTACSSKVATCTVARPPQVLRGDSELMTDERFASNRCADDKIKLLGQSDGSIALKFNQDGRCLSVDGGDLSVANSESLAQGAGSFLNIKLRFKAVIVMKPTKAEIRTSGRCEHLITHSLQCSAAAGGLTLYNFADFRVQAGTSQSPPGCFYYTENIVAPPGQEHTGSYDELPTKVTRLILNVFKDDDPVERDYSTFPECSSSRPCICRSV